MKKRKKKSIKINGERIRAFRIKAGLEQKALAGKIGVDAGTVSRWERGAIDRVRSDVFGRLCPVLDATEDDLCGEEPLPEKRQEVQKGQMNLNIDPACRNALSLVALRYRLTRQRIVEAAPLLFFIAAEQCLQQRRERLRKLREAADRIIDATPSHLPSPYIRLEEAEAEECSIEARDLFGKIVAKTVGEPYPYPGWDPGRDNPFAAFLSAALAGVDRSAEPVSWWGHSLLRPAYTICAGEAANLVGGDAEAADAILQGRAELHEMPPDVRKASPAERAQWARSERERNKSLLDDL